MKKGAWASLIAWIFNKAYPMQIAPTPPQRRLEFFDRISAELDRAYAKHGYGQWGRHEFYGIIKEEFDEMWKDIMRDAPTDVLEKEIVQVAAMCFRYIETRDRYREPANV